MWKFNITTVLQKEKENYTFGFICYGYVYPHSGNVFCT